LAALGYSKNFFLTPKEVQDLGGKIKEGEKGHVTYYWKWNNQGENGQSPAEKEKPLLRYYYAYNIAQCHGIEKGRIPMIEKPKHPLEMCVAIVGSMPKAPEISHGVYPASYMPTLDCIDIPKKDDFPNDETLLLLSLSHPDSQHWS